MSFHLLADEVFLSFIINALEIVFVLIEEEVNIGLIEVKEVTFFEDDIGAALQNEIDILLRTSHIALLHDGIILQVHPQMHIVNQKQQLRFHLIVIEQVHFPQDVSYKKVLYILRLAHANKLIELVSTYELCLDRIGVHELADPVPDFFRELHTLQDLFDLVAVFFYFVV